MKLLERRASEHCTCVRAHCTPLCHGEPKKKKLPYKKKRQRDGPCGCRNPCPGALSQGWLVRCTSWRCPMRPPCWTWRSQPALRKPCHLETRRTNDAKSQMLSNRYVHTDRLHIRTAHVQTQDYAQVTYNTHYTGSPR